MMRCDRRFEQPAIPADLSQTGEQFRIIAAHRRATQETHHSVLRAPDISFELSIQMVRQWKIRAKGFRNNNNSVVI
jgi:hypothetical protein